MHKRELQTSLKRVKLSRLGDFNNKGKRQGIIQKKKKELFIMSENIVMSDTLEALTLRQAVKDTLRNYFTNIGGEQPIDFYSILLEEIERPLLEVLINHTHYNQVKMANILGISRGTLRKKLKQYGLLD